MVSCRSLNNRRKWPAYKHKHAPAHIHCFCRTKQERNVRTRLELGEDGCFAEASLEPEKQWPRDAPDTWTFQVGKAALEVDSGSHKEPAVVGATSLCKLLSTWNGHHMNIIRAKGSTHHLAQLVNATGDTSAEFVHTVDMTSSSGGSCPSVQCSPKQVDCGRRPYLACRM